MEKNKIINEREEIKKVEYYFNILFEGKEYDVYCIDCPEDLMFEKKWDISPSVNEEVKNNIIDFIENQ
jgi:diphthamide synthase (EF-2-diphthine--ammonia ligase)